MILKKGNLESLLVPSIGIFKLCHVSINRNYRLSIYAVIFIKCSIFIEKSILDWVVC